MSLSCYNKTWYPGYLTSKRNVLCSVQEAGKSKNKTLAWWLPGLSQHLLSVSLNDERYKRSLGKGDITGQWAVWELRAPLDTSKKEKTQSFAYGLPELSEEEAEGRAPVVRGSPSLFSLYSCLAPAESAEPQGKCAGEPQLFGSNYGFAHIFVVVLKAYLPRAKNRTY